MGGINVGRWLAGGVAAGVVVFILEGILSLFYMDAMQASLEAFGITIEMTGPSSFVIPVLLSLILGWVLVFFYAASRPRFGPGPKTAIKVAVALWFGGYLPCLLGYAMLGLYATWLLVFWAVQMLVEMILAALAGGWIYREA